MNASTLYLRTSQTLDQPHYPYLDAVVRHVRCHRLGEKWSSFTITKSASVTKSPVHFFYLTLAWNSDMCSRFYIFQKCCCSLWYFDKYPSLMSTKLASQFDVINFPIKSDLLVKGNRSVGLMDRGHNDLEFKIPSI